MMAKAKELREKMGSVADNGAVPTGKVSTIGIGKGAKKDDELDEAVGASTVRLIQMDLDNIKSIAKTFSKNEQDELRNLKKQISAFTSKALSSRL